MDEETRKNLKEQVPIPERDTVTRSLLSWLNQYPSLPVQKIDYEYLKSDVPGMALVSIQGPYKLKKYIRGAYTAEYIFNIVYRVQSETSTSDRLRADEFLDQLSDWAIERVKVDPPDIGLGKKVEKLICDIRSMMVSRAANGDEDHQTTMTLTYNSY